MKYPFSLPHPLTSSLLCLLIALTCSFTHAEESLSKGRTLLDWSEQIGNDPAKAPSHEVYFSPRRGAKPIIVNAQSTPRSPFPNEAAGVYLPLSGDTDQTLAIFFNPFLYQAPPPKGWVEVEFIANNGMVNISLGVDSTNMESSSTITSSSDGRTLFTAFLVAEGNKPILIVPDRNEGEEKQRFFLSSGISVGTTHVFRILWDWTSDTPGIQFQLDGEILTSKKGDEILSVDVKSLTKGIDKLSIFLDRGDIFLGRVTASE